MRRVTRLGAAAAVVAAGAIGGSAAVSAQPDHGHHQQRIQHVLLISVDGMHQSDLNWYVAHHPGSELAKLASGGAEFTNNHTADPSDSDPGGTAIMTGGDPRATGVYYDVEYSHAVDEAGAPCTPGQPATGGDVIYDSPDDKLNAVPDFLGGSGTFPSFDADGSIYHGQNNVDTNPKAIMNMTPTPQTALNPGTFPVDPTDLPADHAVGLPEGQLDLRRHPQRRPAHRMVGQALDLHVVQRRRDRAATRSTTSSARRSTRRRSSRTACHIRRTTDWAHIDAATKQYDGYKVQAIINEIDGLDHSGSQNVGIPAIFGMNFQTVSVAQKVDWPATLNGPDATATTRTVRRSSPATSRARPDAGPAALQRVRLVNARYSDGQRAPEEPGLAGSTAIIVTAKHGQSPQDPLLLKRIKDGPIIDAINAAWTAQTGDPNKLIVAGTDDDLWQSYLSVKTQKAADFVKDYLWNHDATAVLYNNDGVNRGTEQVAHSGLAHIYAGHEAARFFGVPYGDPRYPDVFGRVQVGTVYTGGTKIAEHGGDNPGDRDVPLLVYAPGTVSPRESGAWVETTQVAPTVLRLLGLDPDALNAVQIEGTQVLPGIGEDRGDGRGRD